MDTPIVFIFYNKTETTKQVFTKIREMKPKKLYLVSDGPRKTRVNEKEVVAELRQWVCEQIDWDVSVCKIFSEENMGCKERIVSGLNRVFELEESAIILEDDCLPNHSFFSFCEDMLEYYKNAPQVMMINGSNFAGKKHMIKGDYTFSYNVMILATPGQHSCNTRTSIPTTSGQTFL